MVAEHALLAAQAVAEAEEAAKKASSLLAAANALEDLERGTLDDNQGVILPRIAPCADLKLPA